MINQTCQPNSTLSRYKKGQPLGRGAFGEVHLYECLDGCEHSTIAVKKSLVKTEILTEDEKRQFEKEIELLAKNNHPNIVRYLGHKKGKYLCIILECMPGGSIKDRLRKCGAFTEITTRRYTRDILKGLEYLHSEKNIIHNDIKGGNILLSSQDTAKLADFGISKELRSSTITSGGNSRDGTVRFMSPEVVQCGKGAPRYGRKSDVWSVGCVVVQMLTTEPPWKGYADQFPLMFAIGSRPPEYELPATVSEEAQQFVQACFIQEPDNRPAANELLCFEFLQVQPDKEWHDRLLHILSHMLAEEDFKELKRSFCNTGEMAPEAVHTIDNSFRFFGLLESNKLISVGQYDALIKHLKTMNLEECIQVIREHTEKIEEYRQMQTRQANKVRYVAPPSADVNKYDERGETPLISAAENNDVARVRSLIEAGADLDRKSRKVEWTALMLASVRGHTEVVAELINAGANVDIQDEDGFAALILAAVYGHKEVVAKLIESGADLNIRDKWNRMTALDWAMKEGHREIAEMLKSAGATPQRRKEIH